MPLLTQIRTSVGMNRLRPEVGGRISADPVAGLHGAVAIMLNSLRKSFPGDYADKQERFDLERRRILKDLWLAAQAEQAGDLTYTRQFPEIPVPTLSSNPFANVAFPDGTATPLQTMITLKLPTEKSLQTEATVVKHPENGHHLAEFYDHTVSPRVMRYAVSNPDGPPGVEDSYGAPTQIFDSIDEAFEKWTTGLTQDDKRVEEDLTQWLKSGLDFSQ